MINLYRYSQPVEHDNSPYKDSVPVENLVLNYIHPITEHTYMLTLHTHG